MASFRMPRVLSDLSRATQDTFLKPAKPKNGIGSFVFPCRKLVFNYCERSGSSKAMAEYLQKNAIDFAKANPQIEIIVQPRPSRHPIIRAFYTNGKQKTKCVRRCNPDEIAEVIKSLRDHSGYKQRLWNRPVLSDTPSVRGIYSPFHTKDVHVISDMKTQK